MDRAAALFLIIAERERQTELRDAGRFTATLADDGLTDGYRVAALAEELGEVARAALELAELTADYMPGTTPATLRDELGQLAACCLAWLERFEAPDA